MKIINSVYQEKIYLIKENQFKHETSVILYDLLTKKYGLKNVAERHFFHVVKSTQAFQDSHKRVKIFSEFLKADQEKFKLENLNFWVFALDSVDSVGFGKVLVDDGASEVFCALGSALNAFVNIFNSKVPEKVLDEVTGLVNKMKVVSQVGFKRSSTVKIVENVNLDEFLMICLELYLKCKERIKEKLWPHLDMEEGFNESEFADLMKTFEVGKDLESRIFEKFCYVQRNSDEKGVKMVKVRSLLALVFENGFVDVKELFLD